MDMYILIYLKWITNKDLLCSTWKSGQCYVVAWRREGAEGRMDLRVCMAESLHCSLEIFTMLLIGYIPVKNKKFNKIKY